MAREKTHPEQLKICAIGASAGGLAPVESFFDSMVPDSGIAFVIVQHLSPDHDSMMVQLLESHTSMPVEQAANKTRLQPNHVYLIPPGGELTVEAGHLRVTKRDLDRRHLHRPIDVFFASMAREFETRAAAVILSGTGTDGTAGIEHVANAGGLVLVQDDSAAFEGMPDAAVRSGFVHAVLAPPDLAEAVVEFAQATPSELLVGRKKQFDPEDSGILREIESFCGINFSEYKRGTINRRLQRRVERAAVTLEEYRDLLHDDETERRALIHDLLIDVTSFFRDPDFYEVLSQGAMARLITEAVDNDRPLRVWSVGCATGEETYSLTMLILETIETLGIQPKAVQIFATDVHTGALHEAGVGRYSHERMVGVSPDRRAAFFEQTGNGWAVKSEVRGLITFAEHNILTDPPFTRVDLVVCRNLLIYFRRAAQDRAIGAMTFSLRLGGVLALGPSESLGTAEPDFETINSAWRVWEKTSDVNRRTYRPESIPKGRVIAPKRASTFISERKLLRAYDAVLDSQFAGGLLIDENRELVHTIGMATNWLRPSRGRATLDALSMVHDQELRLAMGSALRELEQGAVEAAGRQIMLPFVDDAAAEQVTKPMMLLGRRLRIGQDQLYVLYTHPVITPLPGVSSVRAADTAEQSSYIQQIEAELLYARESLQASVEAQEISTEELNAANEELIASNEELQSTNEELSSVNEELRTLNEEHRRQLDQVLDLSADLEQLMSSTDIGVVFLAEDRTIRRFNEPARDYFRVREGDVGRPFEDIIPMLDAAHLEADIESAFTSGTAHSRAVKLRHDASRHLLAKIDRYELPRNRWGVFVAVVDISAATIADQEKMLATYLRAAPVSVQLWDPSNVCLYANTVGGASDTASTTSDLFTPELLATTEQENAEVLLNGPLSALRPIQSGDDAPEFVVSKFPVTIEGRTHVGMLGVPASHVEALTSLKEDRHVLRSLLSTNMVDFWKVDRSIGLSAGSAALAPADQPSSGSTSDGPIRARQLDQLAAEVRRAAPSLSPPVVKMTHRDSSSQRWVEVHTAALDEDRDLVAAIDIDRHNAAVLDLVDTAAQLRQELSETTTSASLRSADLSERNRDLDNFAHVAAHDLKAPIRSVRNFSEMALAEIPAEGPAREYLDHVIQAATRMGDLVESLLDFASIDREPARSAAVDLSAILNDVQIDLRSTIEANGAELILLNESPVIQCNTEGIRQVLSNLVGNAIKYSGNEPPRVEISTTSDEKGVTIVVADNGIGFDPSQADRLFEPFQRLHATSVSGSGVGLAICRRIVRRHNGRIWATSEPGVGSRFSVWLPTDATTDLDTSV